LSNVCKSFTNTATATGTPPSGPNVTDSASATVTVENPSIGITKLPASQTVSSGGTATWTIVVTNTGNVPLTNVSVADSIAPNCVKTFTGTLAPGASEASYSCSLANVTQSFTNTATATGTPPVGPKVTASAQASVTVQSVCPQNGKALKAGGNNGGGGNQCCPQQNTTIKSGGNGGGGGGGGQCCPQQNTTIKSGGNDGGGGGQCCPQDTNLKAGGNNGGGGGQCCPQGATLKAGGNNGGVGNDCCQTTSKKATGKAAARATRRSRSR
jgi:uncharacterized repeat protein (TIGR01451 family)